MAEQIERRDLLMGGAAAAIFLFTVEIGLTPWLAIPLAVGTYAIMVPLWSQRDGTGSPDARKQRRAYQAALANAEAIRALQPLIPNPSARYQVGQILERAEQVLAVMREDDTFTAAPLFNDHLMTPARSVLMEYVRLAKRDISIASDLLEKTETHTLPRIERSIDSFHERLHRSHVINLATLGEVIDLDLEHVASSFRRLTS